MACYQLLLVIVNFIYFKQLLTQTTILGYRLSYNSLPGGLIFKPLSVALAGGRSPLGDEAHTFTLLKVKGLG